MTISFPGAAVLWSMRFVSCFHRVIVFEYLYSTVWNKKHMMSLKLVQLLCSSWHSEEGVSWAWNEKRRVKRRKASVREGEGLFAEDTSVITSAWRLAHFLGSSWTSNKKDVGPAVWDWRETSISTLAGSSTASCRRPWSCDINCEIRWQAAVAKLRLREARKYLRLMSLKDR
jgi:hypothetical protein